MGPGLARKKVSDLMYLFSAEGWGRATLVGDVKSEKLIVRLEDCFECSSGEEVKKGCNFMRGYLGGWGKVLLGKDVKSVETRCRLNGDDLCEFVLNALHRPQLAASRRTSISSHSEKLADATEHLRGRPFSGLEVRGIMVVWSCLGVAFTVSLLGGAACFPGLTGESGGRALQLRALARAKARGWRV